MGVEFLNPLINCGMPDLFERQMFDTFRDILGLSAEENHRASLAANAAMVPAGTNGAISVYASYPTDMLFDINGYFSQ